MEFLKELAYAMVVTENGSCGKVFVQEKNEVEAKNGPTWKSRGHLETEHACLRFKIKMKKCTTKCLYVLEGTNQNSTRCYDLITKMTNHDTLSPNKAKIGDPYFEISTSKT